MWIKSNNKPINTADKRGQIFPADNFFSFKYQRQNKSITEIIEQIKNIITFVILQY